MNILANSRARISLIALGAMVAGALIALSFTLPSFQSKDGSAPPASVYQATVDGECSTVVRGFNPDDVWAGPLHGGELRRVNPSAVGVTGCRIDPSR